MRRFLTALCFLCLGVALAPLKAQERKLGTWKMFLPYNTSLGVCNAGDKVYSAAEKSLFWYDVNTGVIQTYDKATGLSDIGIKTIAYDPATKYLVVAYINSNIDLIYNGTDIYNIPDFKVQSTTGAFNINGLSFYNGNCYVSSDMGISVISLERKEISSTYIIGAGGTEVKVYATTVDGTRIYAATDSGVRSALLSSANLQDFNAWSLYNSTSHLPNVRATQVTTFNNAVYANITGRGDASDTIFKLTGNIWSPVYYSTADNDSIMSLTSDNNNLYFSLWTQPSASNPNITAGKNGKILQDGSVDIRTNLGHVRPINWFENNGIAWESDFWNGLYKNNNGNVESVVPDGPFRSDVFSLNFTDSKLYVTAGGVNDSWELSFNYSGFYVYDGVKWTYYNQYSNSVLNGWIDFVASGVVPATGKAYFTSFYRGLAQLDLGTNNITTYEKGAPGTLLEATRGDSAFSRLSAVYVDKHNYTWLGNAECTHPLKLILPDGTWRDFALNYSLQLIKKIMVDQNDQVWMPIRGGNGGMLVWSYNGTIDNTADDRVRSLGVGAGNGNLPDVNVNCVVEDKDGNVWAGTNQGIATFYCPGSILSSNGCDADLIKVERDGYVGYLFGTESIRAMAVDAANRKWVGTTNGVWLISADGKTELLKFNTDNSPLPSNQVTDIAIDDKTGEVFIGTTGGLVSYQGDAMGECTDCNDALVYPNPVKPDYDGPIAIKGLADNAYVKITDVSGTLIYQGRANGSQMIWDGKGYNGQRAKSGVYLVFSSTDSGKQKRVAKILLTN